MAASSTASNPLVGAGGFGKSPAFNPGASFLQSQAGTFPALSSTDDSSSSASSDSGRTSNVTSTQLRAVLASSMSTMYRSEVPLYGDLLSIIASVNSDCIRSDPDNISDDEISRLNVERHGAIRVGTPEELALLARIFRVVGMRAVGYYDLWTDAGLPIHATAFRPVGKQGLLRNPFRIFCSLLRMDLISDPTTKSLAEELLSKRQIVSDRCIELLVKAESALPHSEDRSDGEEVRIHGLTRPEALEFVDQVVSIFAWHADTPVSLAQYQLLSATHPLVADIVSFRGPHINHLTPRTLDIDAVQKRMIMQGIDAKEVVEGPPARKETIYLRQTSFHALSERVVFLGGGGEQEGKHKARFGEIEARGQALTRKGARLYDTLMAKVASTKRQREQGGDKVSKEECGDILSKVFQEGFPDDRVSILRQGLGYFMFSVLDERLARQKWTPTVASASLAEMVESGALVAEPITYEDFLPASAAGIFQSNLPQQSAQEQRKQANAGEVDAAEARKRLESAVGGTILDYFELYAQQQRESLVQVANMLGSSAEEVVKMVEFEGA